MAYAGKDQIDHATVLFSHMINLGKEVNELFKKDVRDGNISGALLSSKMENFYASVQWLETTLVPYLDTEYKNKRPGFKASFKSALKKGNLLNCFEIANEQAQVLYLVAYNKGFMLTQSVSGDHVVNETKEEE